MTKPKDPAGYTTMRTALDRIITDLVLIEASLSDGSVIHPDYLDRLADERGLGNCSGALYAAVQHVSTVAAVLNDGSPLDAEPYTSYLLCEVDPAAGK